MRKHRLGASPPPRGWFSTFRAPRKRSAQPQRAAREEKKGGVFVGYMPTLKGGLRNEGLRRYVHKELAIILDADPDVLRWTTAVEEIQVEHDDGITRGFTPTMLAETARGTRMIKVLRGDRTPGKKAKPRPVDGDRSMFEFIHEDDLRKHPRLPVSDDILFHRARALPRDLSFVVEAIQEDHGPLTLGSLHERLGTTAVPWEDIICLIGKGVITIDLDDGLVPATPIRSVNGAGYLG